ncbi:hypothetical protein MBLNU457_g0449t1 [Dothideomycetes sp. NU457]
MAKIHSQPIMRKAARQPLTALPAKKCISVAGMFKGVPSRTGKPPAKQEKVIKKKVIKSVPHSLSVCFNENTTEYERAALESIPTRLDDVFNELTDALNDTSIDNDEDNAIKKLQALEQYVEEAAVPLSKQPLTIKYIQDGQEFIQHTTLGDSINVFSRDFKLEKQKLEKLWEDWADTQAKIDKLCTDLLNPDADDCGSANQVSNDIRDLEIEIEDATKTSLGELDDQVSYEKNLEKKFQKIWDTMLRQFEEDFDD